MNLSKLTCCLESSLKSNKPVVPNILIGQKNLPIFNKPVARLLGTPYLCYKKEDPAKALPRYAGAHNSLGICRGVWF